MQLYKCYKPGTTNHASYTMEGVDFTAAGPKAFVEKIHKHLGDGHMKQVSTMSSIRLCCAACLVCRFAGITALT